MANSNPSPGTRFGSGQQINQHPGGRTPAKWLRGLLDAANDKTEGGESNREAIARHLIEIATSYAVKIKGRGDNAIEFADAKDSIEAARILWAYDMGKPVEALELSSPDGSLAGPKVFAYLPLNGRGPRADEPQEVQAEHVEPSDGDKPAT